MRSALDAQVYHILAAVTVFLVNMINDELPHEVVLSIQRVLELNSDPGDDPLDVLSRDFNPVDILNGFFPDGAFQPNIPNLHLRLLVRGIAGPNRCGSVTFGAE